MGKSLEDRIMEFDVSSATANRILAKLTETGKLQKIRMGRSWAYEKR